MSAVFDLDAEVVRLIKTKSVELPTYPGIALRLQRLISADDFGIEALSKLVSSDQALAVNVMRAANSAFYRSTAQVTTLHQAISRIGARELSNIAIAGTLGLAAGRTGPLEALRKDSWRASLVNALLCQELARSRKVDAGEAFLAGMLHDFGETIAYACFEAVLEGYPEAASRSAAAWQWEGQRYHVELGMALASDWKLPAFIVEAVMRHTDLEFSTCEFPALVELVSTCDTIALRVLEAPDVEQVDLASVPGLRTDERASLTALLPRVPEFLQSFEDSAAPKAASAKPSLVAVPETTLTGRCSAVSFPVVVVGKDHRTSYEAIEWCPTGLKMVGTAPQPTRHLINLELPGGLKFAATVTLSTVTDASCTVEVKPFAMNRAVSAAWSKLEPVSLRAVGNG